ncbi:hypothetical protein [Roseobacter weihaiensis]|uniref:hypothetical protein n=1 Tax=Roseobacter weihaiensis TaxID=2763262 RepID=UPI001D09AC1A|nr:hypothetical protein [Roseobacter sp. H9]
MPDDANADDLLDLSRDLRIARVETTILDVPIRRKHKLSALTMAHQSYLLVTITTHGGLVGHTRSGFCRRSGLYRRLCRPAAHARPN